MLKRFSKILLQILLLASLSASAQYNICPDELFPRYDGRKKMWGFTNLIGEWIIQPVYTKVTPFRDNKAIVMKGLSCGVIDCQGNVVIQPTYEAITNFRNGRAWVMDNGLWGLASDKNKVLITPQYTDIQMIQHSDLTWVKSQGLWGLFSEEKGQFICKPQYKVAKILSPNASTVQVNDNLFGVLNHVNCAFLIEPRITSLRKVNPRLVTFEINEKWGVFSSEGRIKANPEYDELYLGSPNLFVAKKKGKYGLMDFNGTIVLPLEYDSIGTYGEGLFPVKKGEKYGYASLLGKIYIEPKYQFADVIRDKQGIVEENGKYGVIDLTRKVIIPTAFNSVKRGEHPFYVVDEGYDKGSFIYNLKGEKIIGNGYREVFITDSSEFVRVKRLDGNISFVNLSQAQVWGENYEDAEAFAHGFAVIKNHGKWGVTDSKGTQIVPLKFDAINYKWFSNRLVFYTQEGNLHGVWSSEGKEVLPAKYELVAHALPAYLKVKENGKYGVLKTDGTIVQPAVYESMSNREENPGQPDWPAVVMKDGKYGLLDEKQGEIYQSKGKIEYIGEKYYTVKQKKKYLLIDENGKEYPKAVADSLKNAGEGKFAVYSNKTRKWGYINEEGLPQIENQFEEAYRFENRKAVVKNGGKFGIINTKGVLVVPAEFEGYTENNKDRYLLKGGKKIRLGEDGMPE